MSSVIRELVAKIGFQVDEGGLRRLDDSVSNFKTKLKSFQNVVRSAAIVLGSLGAGITALSVSAARSTFELDRVARQAGINTNELYAMEEAAKAAGLGQNVLTESLTRFARSVGRGLLTTQGTNADFQELGITLRDTNGKVKDTRDAYIEAAKAVANLDNKTQQVSLAYRVFGTTNVDLIKFLAQNDDALREQINTIKDLTFEIDDHSIVISEKMIRSYSQFKTILGSVKDEIGLRFIPLVDDALSGFREWFRLNKEIIAINLGHAISTISNAIRALGKVVSFVFTPIKKAIDFVGGFDSALRLLGVALGVSLIRRIVKFTKVMKGLNLILRLNPLGLWLTAIQALRVAFVFLLEDILSWVEGSDSAIGRVLGTFEGFRDSIISIFSGIGDFIKNIFESSFNFVAEKANDFLDIFSFAPKAKGRHLGKEAKSLYALVEKENELIVKREDNISLRQISAQQEEFKMMMADLNRQEIEGAQEQPLNKGLKVTMVSGVKLPENNIKAAPMEPQLVMGGNIKVAPMEPQMMPYNTSNVSNANNKVTQNITENITVNVPTGTSEEQSRQIATQVAGEMQRQFDDNMLRGINAINTR